LHESVPFMLTSVWVVVLIQLCEVHGEEQFQLQVANLQAKSAMAFGNLSWAQNGNSHEQGDAGRFEEEMLRKRQKFPQRKVGTLEIPLAKGYSEDSSHAFGGQHTTNINFFVNEIPRINSHVESAAKRAGSQMNSLYGWDAASPKEVAETLGSFLEHGRGTPSPAPVFGIGEEHVKPKGAETPGDKIMVIQCVGGLIFVVIIIGCVMYRSNQTVANMSDSSDDEDKCQMQPGMQPGMMPMQPGMMPMQPGMMQPGMQPGMMQPGMMQPGMMQPGMMQPGMMQPGMQPGMDPSSSSGGWGQQPGMDQGAGQQNWGPQGGYQQQQPQQVYGEYNMPPQPPQQGKGQPPQW